jgi:prevent-host-death family protein
MKNVPINILKKDLASVIAEAEAGTEVVITRHNKPVARLTSASAQHVRQGSRFGQGGLKPAVRGKTAGRYLQVLKEDRRTGRQ